MAKYRADMSPSQRAKYNEKMRKRYLRRELEKGRIPHPKKPASWLLELYKEFGVENEVVIPMPDVPQNILKKIRNRERYKRSNKWT